MPRKKGYTSAETKEVIKNSFMEICRSKNIERIKVDELCKAAKVNRSTFYYHYEDIYNLASQVEQDFIEIVENTFPHIFSGIIQQNFDEHLVVLVDFYQKYRKQYMFFMVEKPNQRVIQTIKSFAQEYALHLVGLDAKRLTMRQRLIIEYIASAQMGMICWWMENGQTYSVEELGKLITQINMKGPLPTLFQTIEKIKII